MNNPSSSISNILIDIENQGWSIQSEFFSTELIQSLRQTLLNLHQQGTLKQAGIGRNKNFKLEQSIRSDTIKWFDNNNVNLSQQHYLDIMQSLEQALNQHFYFGLTEFEVHFSLYETKAFYKRHLDQHKNQDTRVISTITYLNENWHEEDGGELCLYLKDDKTILIKPEAGTLVCFLSAKFEHEVLPAKRQRASLTGWFRKRAY